MDGRAKTADTTITLTRRRRTRRCRTSCRTPPSASSTRRSSRRTAAAPTPDDNAERTSTRRRPARARTCSSRSTSACQVVLTANAEVLGGDKPAYEQRRAPQRRGRDAEAQRRGAATGRSRWTSIRRPGRRARRLQGLDHREPLALHDLPAAQPGPRGQRDHQQPQVRSRRSSSASTTTDLLELAGEGSVQAPAASSPRCFNGALDAGRRQPVRCRGRQGRARRAAGYAGEEVKLEYPSDMTVSGLSLPDARRADPGAAQGGRHHRGARSRAGRHRARQLPQRQGGASGLWYWGPDYPDPSELPGVPAGRARGPAGRLGGRRRPDGEPACATAAPPRSATRRTRHRVRRGAEGAERERAVHPAACSRAQNIVTAPSRHAACRATRCGPSMSPDIEVATDSDGRRRGASRAVHGRSAPADPASWPQGAHRPAPVVGVTLVTFVAHEPGARRPGRGEPRPAGRGRPGDRGAVPGRARPRQAAPRAVPHLPRQPAPGRPRGTSQQTRAPVAEDLGKAFPATAGARHRRHRHLDRDRRRLRHGRGRCAATHAHRSAASGS